MNAEVFRRNTGESTKREPAMTISPVTAESILESLTRVIDPEWGINIYDLGLIFGIEAGNHRAEIEMTLTSPDSPSRENIENRIRQVLKRRHPALSTIDIVYRFDPPWRDDFITPEGRQQLESPILPVGDDDLPLTTDTVYEALKLVLDPEVGINVVDLGLVYDVSVIESAVRIEMTLTTPGCPLSATIEAAVRRTIETRHPDVQDISLQIVWEPPWDTDRITDEGRRQLGW